MAGLLTECDFDHSIEAIAAAGRSPVLKSLDDATAEAIRHAGQAMEQLRAERDEARRRFVEFITADIKAKTQRIGDLQRRVARGA